MHLCLCIYFPFYTFSGEPRDYLCCFSIPRAQGAFRSVTKPAVSFMNSLVYTRYIRRTCESFFFFSPLRACRLYRCFRVTGNGEQASVRRITRKRGHENVLWVFKVTMVGVNGTVTSCRNHARRSWHCEENTVFVN